MQDVIDGRRYKVKIVEKGLVQLDISEKLGINNSILNLFLNGRRNLKKEYLQKLNEILEIN
jgi:transcriptional regulator with XRE-family HTH domain